MKIGNIDIKNGICLAPIAGVTDSAFRQICKSMGADLVFSEMVSAKALYYGDRKTNMLTQVSPDERPIGIQLFGSEPEIMGFAAYTLSKRDDVDIIDINMGCPVPKITKNNEGAALMKDLGLAEEIVKEVVKKSLKPVTIKIRSGWEDEEEAVAFSGMIEDAGASALIIHARTKTQMYRGEANWEVIRKVKDALCIPVIGNGDIKNGEDAKRMFDTCGVDGIMVGRGVLGNPWIFREIDARFCGKRYMPPDNKEIIKTILLHFEDLKKLYGTHRAILIMRKHLAWYSKGRRGCGEFKNKVFSITKEIELTSIIREYFSGDVDEI